MTAVEKKLLDVSNLVGKRDYDVEILDIKSKYFTTADYNKFTNEKFYLKLKHKELVSKHAIIGLINNADLDKKK